MKKFVTMALIAGLLGSFAYANDEATGEQAAPTKKEVSKGKKSKKAKKAGEHHEEHQEGSAEKTAE